MSKELDQFIRDLNELFETVKADLFWNKVPSIANRIAAEFHSHRMNIIERALDIEALGFTDAQLEGRFNGLLSEAQQIIEETINSEDPLDLTMSDQGNLAPDMLERTITSLNLNLDQRIREVISEKTGHSNDDYIMAVLIDYLDPNYLFRNNLDLTHIHPEEITAIISSFLTELDSAREEVNSLNHLRDLLTQQTDNIYSIIMDDILQAIREVTDTIDYSNSEDIYILISKAFSQEELNEHEQAIFDSIDSEYIWHINELLERLNDELSSIVEDSERTEYTGTFQQALGDYENQTINPREILNEIYDRIIREYSYSDSRLTTEDVSSQIYLALEQILLDINTEYAVIPEIITHINTIISEDEEVAAAIAKLQEPLETLSLEYDVFEGIHFEDNPVESLGLTWNFAEFFPSNSLASHML